MAVEATVIERLQALEKKQEAQEAMIAVLQAAPRHTGGRRKKRKREYEALTKKDQQLVTRLVGLGGAKSKSDTAVDKWPEPNNNGTPFLDGDGQHVWHPDWYAKGSEAFRAFLSEAVRTVMDELNESIPSLSREAVVYRVETYFDSISDKKRAKLKDGPGHNMAAVVKRVEKRVESVKKFYQEHYNDSPLGRYREGVALKPAFTRWLVWTAIEWYQNHLRQSRSKVPNLAFNLPWAKTSFAIHFWLPGDSGSGTNRSRGKGTLADQMPVSCFWPMVDEEFVRACRPQFRRCLPDLDRIPEAAPFDTSLPMLEDYLKENHHALYDVVCRHLEKPLCLDDEDIQVLAVLRSDAPEVKYNQKLVELLEMRPCPCSLLEVDFGDPVGGEDEVDMVDQADKSGETPWEKDMLNWRE
ncbi:hypothetical protein I350_06038 [Cryptococcus amylolentus CBS 6273]|uniref:Uncharacterized protein n=1 Tax=Cryptococcus amylolentus CBS 6273 TaxID=1296118 RepID=A0A1E3JQU4_9TREE|nr:hypothetical protein I350_06038 [Cryptococcus amylolentus CBS 6273]